MTSDRSHKENDRSLGISGSFCLDGRSIVQGERSIARDRSHATTHFPSPLLRHRPPSPAVSRRRTYLFFFVSTRRIQRRSRIVTTTLEERETTDRSRGSADQVFRFRPRRRTKPILLASSQRGEFIHGLNFPNHQLRRKNRRGEDPTA